MHTTGSTSPRNDCHSTGQRENAFPVRRDNTNRKSTINASKPIAKRRVFRANTSPPSECMSFFYRSPCVIARVAARFADFVYSRSSDELRRNPQSLLISFLMPISWHRGNFKFTLGMVNLPSTHKYKSKTNNGICRNYAIQRPTKPSRCNLRQC